MIYAAECNGCIFCDISDVSIRIVFPNVAEEQNLKKLPELIQVNSDPCVYFFSFPKNSTTVCHTPDLLSHHSNGNTSNKILCLNVENC